MQSIYVDLAIGEVNSRNGNLCLRVGSRGDENGDVTSYAGAGGPVAAALIVQMMRQVAIDLAIELGGAKALSVVSHGGKLIIKQGKEVVEVSAEQVAKGLRKKVDDINLDDLAKQLDGKTIDDLAKGVADRLKRIDSIPWGKYRPNGCEDVAMKIQGAIGGTVHRIKPHSSLPKNANLGLRSGQPTRWFHHEVVVANGRVYDALTGPNGLPIDEYKKLWEYADVINFGF